MGKPAERTLTALLSPFAKAEGAPVPMLFLCGRADRPMPFAGERIVVVRDGLTIGRGVREAATDPGVLLLEDALVSGQHARLVRKGTAFEITDLGSKNGTFVDGQRMDGAAPLPDGARLFIGNHAFVFRLVAASDVEAIDAERVQPLAPVPTASPVLARLCQKLRRLAAAGTDLLIAGETGVGKEIYARAVHAATGRTGRFLAINCAALPRELVESELFGYRPGAHSTAQSGKTGLIEEADGGTLFLDEVGEMPQEMQTKLLRFLQDKEVVPLGANRPRAVNVRVIAATNRPVTPGRGTNVRDDLLGRLGASPITLPPLRERIEDLGVLVAHFGSRDSSARTPSTGAGGLSFELGAFRAMCLYGWPLNVRELEKILSAALAMTRGRRAVALLDFPAGLASPSPEVPPPGSTGIDGSAAARAAAERPTGRKSPEPAPTPGELETLLARHGGQVADVSRALGRQRAAVWRWIKQFGLKPDKYRVKK